MHIVHSFLIKFQDANVLKPQLHGAIPDNISYNSHNIFAFTVAPSLVGIDFIATSINKTG